MKSFLFAAAALVASSPLVASSHLAKRASTTTSPAAAATSSIPPQQAALCPDQNGQTIADAAGVSYKLYCDSYIQSPVFEVETTSVSVSQCMAACDNNEYCLGVVSYGNGHCDLAVGGSIDRIVGVPGYISLVRTDESPSSANTTTTSSSTVSSNIATSSAPSTAAIASPLPTSNATTSDCNFDNLDCPVCDGQSVTDENGITYGVFCDFQVFADSQYSVQKNTSPQSCIEECDSHDWCLGATWHLEGNCELARQGNATPMQMPGYTAFMPLATASATATPTSSWVPTVMPSPIDWDSTLTTTTASSTPATASPTSTCAAASVSCPACDGADVTDLVGQRYHVLCHSRPVCKSVSSPIGNFTADRCMEACDADATCLAALFFKNQQSCDLCQYGISSSTPIINGIPGYVFFLSEAAWNGSQSTNDSASATSSSTRVSLPATSSSSQVSSTTSEQMFSILPFPVVTTTTTSSSSSEPMFSILPFPVNTTTTASTTTEQMFSILPSPVKTSTTASGTFSITTLTVTASGSYETPTSSTASAVPPFPPTSFTAPTSTASPTPSSLPDMSSVSCPSSQNTTAYDSTSDRAFQIQCDSTFRAANRIIIAVSDLDACAGMCSDGCDGVEYASQTCSLLAGITAMGYKRGFTAAAAVTVATATDVSSTTTNGGEAGVTPTSAIEAATADQQTRVVITKTMTYSA